MAALWRTVCDTFWSEKFWLSDTHSWDDLKNKDDGIYRPQTEDFAVPLFTAVALFVLRRLLEWAVLIPIGNYFGMKAQKVVLAPPNKVLEKVYRKIKKPDDKVVQDLMKQTDMSSRQIERWFRIRRNQDKTQVLYKFTECSWRCLFYLTIFWYGVFVLWDKPWFWESKYFWKDWPLHHVSSGLYWYYMIEAGFYLSLIFTMFNDVRRKDFVEMLVHHLATLALMFLSWSENMVRVGSLILLVHDAVDYWLEGAKLAKYIGKQKLCDFCFLTFSVVWVITRMIIFPVRIVYSTVFESITYIEIYPVYYAYSGLLITLQILHIYWFTIICKMIYAALKKGETEKDLRSSCEETVSEDDNKQNSTNQIQNNSSSANQKAAHSHHKDGVVKRN